MTSPSFTAMPDIPLPKPTLPSTPTPVAPAPVPTPTPPTPTPAAPRPIAASPLAALPPSRFQPQASVVQKSTTLPPSTLTALSSMGSSKLPTTNLADTTKDARLGAATTAQQATSASLKVVPENEKAKEGSVPKPPAVKLASLKQSPLRFLPIALVVLIVVGVIFMILRGLSGSKSTSVGSNTANPGATTTQPSTGGGTAPATNTGGSAQAAILEYWGLWEPAEVMKEVLADFEKQNPGISVRYTKQSYRDYRQRLQAAITSGNGPDLFRFHASWTPMLSSELARMPASIYSASQFQSTFYPVATTQLQLNGQLVGIPLMYDGLALFYNKEALATATADPPTTWSELRTLAAKLTIKSGSEIKRGGVALGNATNVDHYSDIIALLMLQNGADLSKPDSKEGRDALLFYTNFQKADGVWNSTLPSSTTAFARGEAAMFFAPSWRAHDIAAINPDLEFGIAPLPQLSDTRITWASYWAEGVSQKSKQQEAAWKLLKHLSSKEVQQKLHADQAGIRSFGEIYSRTDLADEAAKNPFMQPFLQDAPFASGWYLSSMTFDAGINDQIIAYYEKAITGSLGSQSMASTLTELEQGTAQTLQQFGVQ